jgi:tripartite-type tricarboxylate transporter receptor subunit TctC
MVRSTGVAFRSALLALLISASAAVAQPSGRVVTMIVPYAAGGGVDVVARAVADQLQQRLGQPIIVDNKPGASGNIGTQAAARAPADGHTLLMVADPPFTANVSLMKNVPYDPVKGFTPVAEVVLGTMALTVNASLPTASTKEFIDYVKARPAQINYGSSGVGTPHHLAMEFFKRVAGLNLMHVPFRDNAGATSNLLGGHVSAIFLPLNVSVTLPQDKVRILAVTSTKRSPAAPNLPTVMEAGLEGFEADVRFGILAPPGTPNDIVQRTNAAINEVVRSAPFVAKMTALGLVPTGGTPEDYGRGIAADFAKWRKVIAEAGIAE